MTKPLSNIDACVFDAYGTLFDVHSAAGFFASKLGDLEKPVSELWRAKQLQYTWLRSLMNTYHDFWEVTENALDFALATYDINNAELRNELMESYLRLTCFEEVPEVLRTLSSSGVKNAILSNGSPKMLEPLVKNSDLGGYLDACLSVDEVSIYKPAPVVYELACKRLNVKRENVAFMSSNCWDAIGAANYGFRVIWVNRYAQKLDRLPASPELTEIDLRRLPTIAGVG